MRSLGTVTEEFTQPAAVVREERDGCTLFSTPERRDYWCGNKHVLDAAPPSRGAVEAELRALESDLPRTSGVEHLLFEWESASGEYPAWADELGMLEAITQPSLVRDAVLVLEGAPTAPPDPGVNVRAVDTPEDWRRLVELTDLVVPPDQIEFYRWKTRAQRELVTERHDGGWWAVETDGLLASSAGQVRHDGVARFQSVQTHPAFRRRGFAAHLCHWIARRQHEAHRDEPQVLLANSGSSSQRIYERLGFRVRSYYWTLMGRPKR